jgi:hypothetical protein
MRRLQPVLSIEGRIAATVGAARVWPGGIDRASIILRQREAQKHPACRRERHREQQPDDP